ncbi:MAG: ChbG/HpnK family deacetylase [Candidatus Yanofskybacteria bacterium]|nr:ChbG/HpnK family deacetylase [Candidatus Yanofskybacteria bacterium]
MSHKLFVVADDLGLHKLINDGIIWGLKNGLIGGASLMANGKAFDDAIIKLKNIPNINTGIHINFVEEGSLVSGKVMPKNHRIFFVKYLLGFIKKEYIKKEAEVQIKKCIQAGIKPSFINGNQHLHLLPGIMNIILNLAVDYRIPYIRIVNEPINLTGGRLLRKFQLLFLNFLSARAKKKIKKTGLECNDFFVGFINAGNLAEKDIKLAENLAQKYPDKIIELGCHPGYENEDLRIRYRHWGNYNWQKELELLKIRNET